MIRLVSGWLALVLLISGRFSFAGTLKITPEARVEICDVWLTDHDVPLVVYRLNNAYYMPESLRTIDYFVVLHVEAIADRVRVFIRAIKKSALNKSHERAIDIGGKSVNIVELNANHFQLLARQRRVGEIRVIRTPGGLALSQFASFQSSKVKARPAVSVKESGSGSSWQAKYHR